MNSVTVCTDVNEAFKGIHLALFVGSKPRTKGMERKDLLEQNGDIFRVQVRRLSEALFMQIEIDTNGIHGMYFAGKGTQ